MPSTIKQLLQLDTPLFDGFDWYSIEADILVSLKWLFSVFKCCPKNKVKLSLLNVRQFDLNVL